MFDLLDEQQFHLHIDLLDTLVACSSLSVNQVLGSGRTSATSLSMASCTNDPTAGLSTKIALPYQGVTVQLVIADIQLIGGVRIGLSGNGTEKKHCILRDLDFRQTFSVSDRTLAQTANINLQLTKVILFLVQKDPALTDALCASRP